MDICPLLILLYPTTDFRLARLSLRSHLLLVSRIHILASDRHVSRVHGLQKYIIIELLVLSIEILCPIGSTVGSSGASEY